MVQDLLGDCMEGTNIKGEITESFKDNPFFIYSLASKAIRLYTRVNPKLVYFATNSLFAKEYETKFPILFPLVNLIDLGITNYFDVTGCLNVTMTQK